MNKFVQQIIKKKLTQVTPAELQDYGEEYGIHLSEKQAKEITTFVRKSDLNPLEQKDRMILFKKLAQITDIKTAQKTQKLFNKLIREYGVESWFD